MTSSSASGGVPSPRRWTLEGGACAGIPLRAITDGPEIGVGEAVEVMPVAEHQALMAQDAALERQGHERTDDRSYDLRQRLNRAVRWLRDAEDIARIEMPAWPTADRIRSIYEQVTEDVLNGKKSRPPVLERLAEAEAELARLWDAAQAALTAWEKGYVPPDDTPAEVAFDALRAVLSSGAASQGEER